MKTPYTLIFNQQQKIQFQVAKKFGYSINPSSLQASKVSMNTQKTMSINRNIKPLQIERTKPILSIQHEKLLKEIAQSQQEKRMRKKFQQRNEVDFNIIRMMNDRIKQYNYLIEHKHIGNSKDENSKKTLKLNSRKSQIEGILQDINNYNKELEQVLDTQRQRQVNKNISHLYKKYKQKMLQEKNEKEKKRLHQTLMIKQQVANTKNRNRLYSVGQSTKRRNNSECISNNIDIKIKYSHYRQRGNGGNTDRKQEEDINMEEPYLNREEIKKSNEIQRRQELNREIIQLYRGRINTLNQIATHKQKYHAKRDKGKRKSTIGNGQNGQPNIQSQAQHSYNPFDEILDREPLWSRSNQRDIEEIKDKRRTQQKYFSSYLQKRNRKFKKPWGNKILIKYDSQSHAKEMLEGNTSAVSPQTTQYFNSRNTSMNATATYNHSKQKSPKSMSYKIIPNHLSEDEKMIIESMEQQKNDSKLYEIMCKNEKINLYFKGRKKGKQ